MASVTYMTTALRCLIRAWARNDAQKIEAVTLVKVQGMTVLDAARHMGRRRETVRQWIQGFESTMVGISRAEKIDVRTLVRSDDAVAA